MKHPETYTVSEKYGVRPAGKPDECFYCYRKLGEQHAPDCSIRVRTVVVKMSMDLVMVVPESWNTGSITGYFNDSWCADNAIPMIEQIKGDGCLCNHASFEFSREASSEDEKRAHVVDKKGRIADI